ncbi:MAG: hypothetical protein WC420_01000 [Candidatus Paceibacterota bacterium]|jgi:hypothetical protein
MKLFSKRNNNIGIRESDPRLSSYRLKRLRELIPPETRNRIISEIKFLTSSDDFLEFFILFENQKKDKIFFDKNKIDKFSLSELGYKMTDFFEFEEFDAIQQKSTTMYIDGKEKESLFFDDYKLFDLAEIVILFAKSSKRGEVINRFNAIFTEENSDFQIVEHLITKKSGETLKTLVSLLRDDNLKNKIKIYFDFIDRDDYINSSKTSSDILNIIFSGYIKNNKPKDITVIKESFAQKILKTTPKKEEKISKFLSYIDDLLKVAKNLSNNIYDIRHTEKSTIQVTNDNLYKLISNFNISIVELFLTTLKDDYVLGDNWEKIKSDYIEKYKIDKDERYYIKDPKKDEDINPKDIPF